MISNIPVDAREIYYGEDGQPIAYCPKDSIGGTDLSRMFFFQQHQPRLQELAWRQQSKGGIPENLMLVCIDVDDPRWTPLVQMLMPYHDWDAFRARGERPVALGTVEREGVSQFAEHMYPALGDDLRKPLPAGDFRCAVFHAGGVGSFSITPKEEKVT